MAEDDCGCASALTAPVVESAIVGNAEKQAHVLRLARKSANSSIHAQ